MTDIRQKLASIFQGEHAEHLEHIRSILALLENVGETHGRVELDEAFRRAHSLKGAARAVDLDVVEELASGLETVFSRVRQGTLLLDQQTARIVHRVLDASEECVEAFRENRISEPPAAALRAIEALLGEEHPETQTPAGFEEKAASAATLPAMGLQPVEMVRLPAENLDRLVRSTGMILTESLRQESVTGELDTLDQQIAEMTAECGRFRKASAAPLWRLAGQPEYASVIRHIALMEQNIRALGVKSRAVRQSCR